MALTKTHRQLSLPGLTAATGGRAHGGDHTQGKRKTSRPFDPKQGLHVVLRSSCARGQLSMLHPKHCNRIRDLVARLQKRWNVQVYRYANVGNHLHLLIRARRRADWQGFIRQLGGGIAMLVTGAAKGNAFLKKSGPNHPAQTESARRAFWDHLVFTRIVSWGRDFRGVARYVAKNLWDGLGIPIRGDQRGGRVPGQGQRASGRLRLRF